MATRCDCSSSVPSLPPPCPKSPPEYPDLYGKRRETAKVQMLEREIGFLEVELKAVQGLQPASRCCKEVVDFVVANQDPLIPTYKKNRRRYRFWKWLCGFPCFNGSWICCCCCCDGCSLHLETPQCCKCSIPCNCQSCVTCTVPKWPSCSCPRWHCCNGMSCSRLCCSFSLADWCCCKCKCRCRCKCSCPKCPDIQPSCCCCTRTCCNPCSFCYCF